MISNMAFQVANVRDFLAENGHVATVRGYRYRSRTATVGNLDNIRITRTLQREIKTIEDLNGFVPLSGFKTVREWWKQIKAFCHDKMYLYLVKIDDTEIVRQERSHGERDRQRTRQAIFSEVCHPADDIGTTDPALVDLASYREAAQQQRENENRERRQARQRRQREQYSEQMKPATTSQRSTPREIMQVSDAEKLLSSVVGGIL